MFTELFIFELGEQNRAFLFTKFYAAATFWGKKFSLLKKAVEQGVEIDPELLMDKSMKDTLKMRLLSKSFQLSDFFKIFNAYLSEQHLVRNSFLESILLSLQNDKKEIGYEEIRKTSIVRNCTGDGRC